MSSPPRLRLEDQELDQQTDHLNLELLPGQPLLPGRVHVLPHLDVEQHQPQHRDQYLHQPNHTGEQSIFFTPLEGYPVDIEKYKVRVTEIAAGLQGFSPSQTYQRYYQANIVARGEQYNKHHSALTRLKNVFKKH